MSAKTQSKSTFSRKVRKHYEFPVQLNPKKGKNLVLEQYFRSPRFTKWWTPEIAGRPAGPPPAFTVAALAHAQEEKITVRDGCCPPLTPIYTPAPLPIAGQAKA